MYSSSALADLPPTLVQYLSQSDERRYLTASLTSNFSLILVDASTRHILEANAVYHSTTGWLPTDIEERQRNPPPITNDQHRGPPYCRVRPPRPQDEATVARWRDRGPIRQYPAALRLHEEVWAGRRQSMHEQWRVRFADGHQMEIDMAMWCARTEEVVEEEGKVLRPKHFVICFGSDSPVRVDEVRDGGGGGGEKGQAGGGAMDVGRLGQAYMGQG